MLRSNAVNLASLSNYSLMMLNGRYSYLFSSDFIYFGISAMLLGVTLLTVVGMKDIIKDQISNCEHSYQRVSAKFVMN
jgi:hypothetical protein